MALKYKICCQAKLTINGTFNASLFLVGFQPELIKEALNTIRLLRAHLEQGEHYISSACNHLTVIGILEETMAALISVFCAGRNSCNTWSSTIIAKKKKYTLITLD